MLARQLIGLRKSLRQLEQQTRQLQAAWRNLSMDLKGAQQAGAPVLGCNPSPSSTRSGWGLANRSAAVGGFGAQRRTQPEPTMLYQIRQFTSSSSGKAAAEEAQAAAKTNGNGPSVSKAAVGVEAASTSGQQAEPSVAMRKGRMSGPVSWASLALLLITGGGLLMFYDREKRRKLETVRQGPSVGKAAIGGAFELVNQDNRKVTDKDFRGNWNLVYFGFTFCPDICPDELNKMAEAIDKVEKSIGVKVVPIFISVDPERDTVQQVGRYVKEFHPRLVGLTGSADAVKQAAKAYRVYYMKTEEEGDDYLVDHSIIQYLMDPNMDFVKFFGKNYTADTLAEGIASEIKAVDT